MAKKTILSPEQDAAATPTKNVWVQANAGTGKTSVLTQRLLRILFRTTDCLSSGILCLTYTNAGAGEMRNRILRALREWAMADDSDLIEMLDGIAINRPATQSDIMRAREIFFTYIDNPDLLKVKTIHGFCEEILHRFPLEAGISPSWSLVSDSAQRVLLQDSFSELINNGGQDTT
ncbi:MAG: UvrD-helicase domain-containing protein, partial [Alphaproteobacteria bacterium]